MYLINLYKEFENDKNGLAIPTSEKYAYQEKVFNCLGQEMLDNLSSGYHCCVFAYGQTGSGKSYSMFGYEPNLGEYIFYKRFGSINK